MNETHILVRLLRIYIPQNWEFGSALSKLPSVCQWLWIVLAAKNKVVGGAS
jgi:hypothetical protein